MYLQINLFVQKDLFIGIFFESVIEDLKSYNSSIFEHY